jgi:hypothetical protein
LSIPHTYIILETTFSPLNLDKTLTKKITKIIKPLSEYLSDYMAQKLYTNLGAKGMVIILGKQKNLTTPPSFSGPKCRGEILIYIPWQKRYLILGQNLKTISPPTLCQK